MRTPATTEVSGRTGDAPSTKGRYLLVVGEGRLLTVPLPTTGQIVLGRDPGCDVPLPHAKISRHHARVIVAAGEVAIEDLGSTNGLKIGGARLARGVPAPLPIGEGVRLGPFAAIVLHSHATTTADGLPCAAIELGDPTLAGATELLRRIAEHGVGVLIQGETGTGKEVLATTLHQLSGRAGELIAINCAALSGPLLESELFGHERGAFTGATRTKPGLLEVAARGTALLDEIGDLPLELQGKLLRALESRQFYRVGGVQPIELRARIVAATHRDLPSEVTRGAFRQDLYFRLNGITLCVKPLRDRRDRIASLAAELAAQAARASGLAPPRLTPPALAALAAHTWPGNVRELRLVIERALLLSDGKPIEVGHLLLTPACAAPPPVAADDSRARFERVARKHHGNAIVIARELGTSRAQVHRLAKRLGLDLEALRDPT